MKLYLVRHGIATPGLPEGIRSDAERPLTNEGRAETKQVAQGLLRLGLKPDLFVSSPLVRARQTAKIMADVLVGRDDMEICSALAPGGSASETFSFLRKFNKANEIILFGHEPDMGQLAASLIWAGPDCDIPFKKAGVCRIDVTSMPPNSPGVLKWFVTPKIACLIDR